MIKRLLMCLLIAVLAALMPLAATAGTDPPAVAVIPHWNEYLIAIEIENDGRAAFGERSPIFLSCDYFFSRTEVGLNAFPLRN